MDAALRLVESNLGIEPKHQSYQDCVLTIAPIRAMPFWETCASGGSAAFLEAEYHTSRVRPVATGLERFTRLRSILLAEGRPSPINCSQALGGKNCLAPANCPSSSAVDVWRRDSARCDPRPLFEHLPSAAGASPIFQHSAAGCHADDTYRIGFAWLSPNPKIRGGETGLLSLSLPFDRII